MRTRRPSPSRGLLAATTIALLAMLLPATASAVQPAQDRLVREAPADHTPHVLDGLVESVAVVGDRVVVGGTFTRVAPETSGRPTVNSEDDHTDAEIVEQPYLFAFDRDTGAIDGSFMPDLDGDVLAIEPAGDGESVYVAGRFTTVNGGARAYLTRVRLSDGGLVPGFGPSVEGPVFDLVRQGGTLYAGVQANAFGDDATTEALVSLSATTGQRTDAVEVTLAGAHSSDDREGAQAAVRVRALDVSPDGQRLVAVGNFRTADDLPREHIVVLDLGGDASVANWRTRMYPQGGCRDDIDDYMNDVEISPDGRYLVVVTAGGTDEDDQTILCDTAARFELAGATGQNLPPTWVQDTGGDTLTAVALTGEAVYVGGHFRWMNQAVSADDPEEDEANPGSVAREGLAALDPRNGVPYTWNPGRTRGDGVFAMQAAAEGIYMGSDTARWNTNGGDFDAEYQNRLALFPLSGPDVPVLRAAPVPTDLYRAPQSGRAVELHNFDGEQVGEARQGDLGINWGATRGAFAIGDRLYRGTDDGRLERRSFDGTSSAVVTADVLGGLPAQDFPVSQVTGMTFDHEAGRIYYTLAGQNALFHRAFTPQSDIVGDRQYRAVGGGGVDWSTARGLHLDVASGSLFFGSTDGNLRRASFDDGAVGGAQVIDGPARGTAATWDAGALFTHGQGSEIPGGVGGTGVSPVVLGGSVAIGDEVVQAVDAITGGDDARRWSGPDRFATAVKVSEESFSPGVPVAYVANGHNFPDALAGGAAAGLLGGPVLLVAQDGVPDVVADELERLQPERIVVLGGTVAISAEVQQALDAFTAGAVRRLGGANRYATAALLSRETFDPGVSQVWIATGQNFPDALAAGPAAVGASSPILLVEHGAVPTEVVAELQRLEPDRIMIAGGGVAVSAEVEAALQEFAARGVTRVSGPDRYATASAISRLAFPQGAVEVFVATGENFPDALAGSAAAGRLGAPIVLAGRTQLPEPTQQELSRLDDLAAGG